MKSKGNWGGSLFETSSHSIELSSFSKVILSCADKRFGSEVWNECN